MGSGVGLGWEGVGGSVLVARPDSVHSTWGWAHGAHDPDLLQSCLLPSLVVLPSVLLLRAGVSVKIRINGIKGRGYRSG